MQNDGHNIRFGTELRGRMQKVVSTSEALGGSYAVHEFPIEQVFDELDAFTRERGSLAGMLQVHPTLRSVGVIEKEPTTRSERTYWLDTRGKEAIGRALLDSPGTVMFLQCDVFALNENTTTLLWTSRAPCDAIVLAGVLRSNSVLTSLNLRRVLGVTGSVGVQGVTGYS